MTQLERKLVIKFCSTCNKRQSVYNNQLLCKDCGFALQDYNGEIDKMKIICMPEEHSLNEKELKAIHKHYQDEFVKNYQGKIKFSPCLEHLDHSKDGFICDEVIEGEPVVDPAIFVVWEKEGEVL